MHRMRSPIRRLEVNGYCSSIPTFGIFPHRSAWVICAPMNSDACLGSAATAAQHVRPTSSTIVVVYHSSQRPFPAHLIMRLPVGAEKHVAIAHGALGKLPALPQLREKTGEGGLHPRGSGENGTHGVMRFPRLDLSQSPLPRAPSVLTHPLSLSILPLYVYLSASLARSLSLFPLSLSRALSLSSLSPCLCFSLSLPLYNAVD